MSARSRRIVVLLVLLACVEGVVQLVLLRGDPPAPAPSPSHAPVKAVNEGHVTVGYFHGGRTGIAYRTYVNGYFEREDVNVDYMTCNLRDPRFFVLPRDNDRVREMKHVVADSYSFGKIGGEQLIDAVIDGRLDGTCVGEASFLMAVQRGAPIVAVCSLGHDRLGNPGHAIIFRKGLTIRGPQDIKGKNLVSRRAGPGDETMLREWLRSEGLDPDKDVNMRSKVDDDECVDALLKGEVDGGFYHLMALRDIVDMNEAFIYRPFNWVNPEIAQSLLIFRRDYVAHHRAEVERMVRGIVRRVYDESRMSGDDRSRGGKGERIDLDFHGLNLPGTDNPPYVRRDMLVLMQGLLMRNGFLKERAEVGPYIDNSLVEQAWLEVSQRAPAGAPSSKASR